MLGNALSGKFYNGHLLEGDGGALARAVELSEAFLENLPQDEDGQELALRVLIDEIGADVRAGAWSFSQLLFEQEAIVRLYKSSSPTGRIKLQVFVLGEGDAHPAHAHQDLLSCQIVLDGVVNVQEYSLVRRVAPDKIEVRTEEPKTLRAGEGFFTLQMKNNVHSQAGGAPKTVLLNINWQGWSQSRPELIRPEMAYGRRYLDLENAQSTGEEGRFFISDAPL